MAYIRRLIPCAPYEIKTFEAWLEELAQEEGLFLVSCRRAFATVSYTHLTLPTKLEV